MLSVGMCEVRGYVQRFGAGAGPGFSCLGLNSDSATSQVNSLDKSSLSLSLLPCKMG